MKFANGIPDTIEANLPLLDELGGPKTYNHYPNGWAMAFNTPFKMWKRYEFNGGTSDPCIISWPAGMKARGEIREQYHHAIDLVPTILDVLGVEAPETIKGHVAEPVRRRQHALELRRRRRRRRRGRRSSTRCSARGRSGTTAGRRSRTTRRSPAGATSTTTSGSCTTPTSTARSCTTSRPSTRRRCASSSTSGSPRRAPTARSRSTTARRSRSCSRRGRCSRRRANRYVYFPDTAEVPESQAVNVRNRSYAIGALVDIPAPGAEGVLFAHGSRFGGHALYVKDNRLHYVYNFVGMFEQKVVATEDAADRREPDPLGVVRQGPARTRRASRPARSRSGTATTKVGEGAIKTQPGKFMIAGEGLCIGRDGGAGVTDDYPGTEPWRFTGGTIHRVAVDVSGEPYVDLEREAQAMLMRE